MDDELYVQGGQLLVALSQGFALLALWFLWRRRAILVHFVLPRRGYAHPEWAAYTFPTAATAGGAGGKGAPPCSIPPHLEYTWRLEGPHQPARPC